MQLGILERDGAEVLEQLGAEVASEGKVEKAGLGVRRTGGRVEEADVDKLARQLDSPAMSAAVIERTTDCRLAVVDEVDEKVQRRLALAQLSHTAEPSSRLHLPSQSRPSRSRTHFRLTARHSSHARVVSKPLRFCELKERDEGAGAGSSVGECVSSSAESA